MYPTPWTTSAIIVGIVCTAACPPLMIIAIIVAVAIQTGHGGKKRRASHARARAHAEREYDAGIRYFRS